MKKILIAVAILGWVVVLLLLLPPAEPRYRGRMITAWQNDWAAGRQDDIPAVLQHIGTNAIPYAVRNLALNDSRWRSNYCRLQAWLPSPLQRLIPTPKPLLKVVDGANVFFYVGSNSIPHAVTLLKHKSPTVRQAAAWGLGAIRKESAAADQAIPALIEALTDRDRQVRFYAAMSLKDMGAAASNAVPALTKVVADTGVGPQTNSYFYLRAVAAVALGKVGPAAASALPVLKATLQAPNSYLRGQAAVAIWRISLDVDTALPALLREMTGVSEHSKWDWIVALGEMGPRAKAAVPQLTKELEQDKEPWILGHVTNAFKSIDPEAAREVGVK